MAKTKRVVFAFDERSYVSLDELKARYGEDSVDEIEIRDPETGATKTLVLFKSLLFGRTCLPSSCMNCGRNHDQ